MKIKALVSFLVAVCFVTVSVLAQAPVEKKAEKAKIFQVLFIRTLAAKTITRLY